MSSYLAFIYMDFQRFMFQAEPLDTKKVEKCDDKH